MITINDTPAVSPSIDGRHRGFALAYFLLIGTVIIMLTGAVMTLGSGSLQATRGGVDANRALYAAEAGLALIVSELERDAQWHKNLTDEELPNRAATYSASFFSGSGTPTIDQCVNNLISDTPAASYRGPNTIPPHSALLVVTGHSGTVSRTIEALVVTGASLPSGYPLLVEERIELYGSIRVNGRVSLSNTESVSASLHSNRLSSSDDGEASSSGGAIVTYEPDLSLPDPSQNELTVSGRITSSDTRTESEVFNISLPFSSHKLKSNAPVRELPRPNIRAMMDDAKETALILSSNPTPQNLTIQEDRFSEGDFELNGDLILKDNASLYIDGDLIVNGSIRGKGKVVVTGNTEFHGDFDVAFAQDDYLAVLSHGHVVIKGFDGQRYLENLALSGTTLFRDPLNIEGWPSSTSDRNSSNYPSTVDSAIAIRNLSGALNLLKTDFIDPSSYLLDGSTVEFQDSIGQHPEGGLFAGKKNTVDAKIDILQSYVSAHPSGAARGWTNRPKEGNAKSWLENNGLPKSERTHNNAGLLRDYMAGQGGSELSTTTFLTDRFERIGDLFRKGDINRDGSQMVDFIDFFRTRLDEWDGSQGGIFDFFQSISEQRDDWIPEQRDEFIGLIQAIIQFDYDRLGQANFKGLIYTNGAFVATDDLNVLGTIVVNKDPKLPPLDFNGKKYKPGNASFSGYTTLTYVEELFDDGINILAGSGALDIQRWVAR